MDDDLALLASEARTASGALDEAIGWRKLRMQHTCGDIQPNLNHLRANNNHLFAINGNEPPLVPTIFTQPCFEDIAFLFAILRSETTVQQLHVIAFTISLIHQ